jgi:hypothetical protein
MLVVLFSNAKSRANLTLLQKKVEIFFPLKKLEKFFGVEKNYLSMIEVNGLSKAWTCGL